MLRVQRRAAAKVISGGRFALVAARYNSRYVEGMLRAAKAELLAAGSAVIEIIRVPGAFEIPLAAAVLARRTERRPEAIVCLGVIWQGETPHAQHIGEAVTTALMQLAVETGVPVVHGVLTIAQPAQAQVRCLEPKTNRGTEAARTALAMARLRRGLRAA